MSRTAPISRARAILDASRALLEEVGVEAFALRDFAARVGIRAPSLYRHFEDKQAIFRALAADGFTSLAAALERSERTLHALSRAYRDFARTNPALYRLMYDCPLPPGALPSDLVGRAFAPLLTLCRGDVDEARAAWAFAHGLASLELTRRFPVGADLDAAWQSGIARLEKRAPRTR